MYLFINENEIQEYNGDILSYSVGKRLIKTVANPTENDLRAFGYKSLIEDVVPEPREGFYIQEYYEDGINITKKYKYIENIINEE